jgi:hypothetical protein
MFIWAFGPLVIWLVTCGRQIHSLLDMQRRSITKKAAQKLPVSGCAVQRGRGELPYLACHVHLILS